MWFWWPLGWANVTKSAVMATWVDSKSRGFFGGYRGWLRIQKVAFVLTLLGFRYTE